ncbi:MAG TPA: hypothetical protein VL426_07705 [Candidatus Binatia bacterium]|nr:hypothetical protein [Candidatus Binatia bacterium]
MTLFRRKNSSRVDPAQRDSVVGTIILALLIGVIIGFSSGWEISALQFRRPAPSPALSAEPAVPPAEPLAPPAEEKTLAPAELVTYRAVVDAVTQDGLQVTVMEGVAGSPKTTLLVSSTTDLAALRPKEQAPSVAAPDTTKGLPTPPKAVAEPYEEVPMTLDAFRVGDVVEFQAEGGLVAGARLEPAKVLWIMNIAANAELPGPNGAGQPAPPPPSPPPVKRR